MIHVEIRTTTGTDTDTGYRVAADITIHDNGTHTIYDPEHLLPLQLEVPVPNPEGGHPTRVTFKSDPTLWTRHLSNLLRTPYLHAVVVTDRPADTSRLDSGEV